LTGGILIMMTTKVLSIVIMQKMIVGNQMKV